MKVFVKCIKVYYGVLLVATPLVCVCNTTTGQCASPVPFVIVNLTLQDKGASCVRVRNESEHLQNL